MERRELEVVGRANGGESCDTDCDAPDSEVDEVPVEMLLLPPPTSTSGLLCGASRGLGASEGASLATRLCAYELNASGVENGA